jgi:hypothetical protein
MAKPLYPRFLEDAGEYQQAERYWERVWTKATRAAGQARDWKSPWLTTRFVDGTPIRTGSPMFSAINNRLQRAVRVIQEAPANEGDLYLDCWVDTFGDETSPDAVQVLVIACVPSNSTETVVSGWLHEWLALGEVTKPLLTAETQVISLGDLYSQPVLQSMCV